MKYLIAWWIVLSTTFIYIFALRLDLFLSVYFFIITASTVGYGEILPTTVLEQSIVSITVATAYVSLPTVTVLIVSYFIGRKKMDKFKGRIEKLIITSNPSKLESILKELGGQRIHVICDSEDDKVYDEIVALKASYNIHIQHLPSMYSTNIFNDIGTIANCCICASEESSVSQSNHRVFGLISIIEQHYPECVTIGEVKGDIKRFKQYSSGDKFVPVTDGILLAHELNGKDAFNMQHKLIEKLRGN